MADRRRLHAFVVLVALLASCRGTCNGPPRPPPLGGALALVPDDAAFLLSVDVAKVARSTIWQKLRALARADKDDRRLLDGLIKRTGLDPFTQIHSILLAFPDDARARGQFGMIVRGEGFDERRLVAFAVDQAQRDGSKNEVRAVKRGSRTLWTETRAPGLAGFFIGSDTFVLGSGGWAQAMADLSDGVAGVRSAETRADLVSFAERAAYTTPDGPVRSVWGVAVLPPSLRKRLRTEPRYAAAASIARLSGSLDVASGLAVELVADLSNQEDARTLVTRTEATLSEAKRSPSVLIMGLGPALGAIKVRSDGPRFVIGGHLEDAQVEDLMARARGLSRMGRAAAAPAASDPGPDAAAAAAPAGPRPGPDAAAR